MLGLTNQWSRKLRPVTVYLTRQIIWQDGEMLPTSLNQGNARSANSKSSIATHPTHFYPRCFTHYPYVSRMFQTRAPQDMLLRNLTLLWPGATFWTTDLWRKLRKSKQPPPQRLICSQPRANEVFRRLQDGRNGNSSWNHDSMADRKLRSPKSV